MDTSEISLFNAVLIVSAVMGITILYFLYSSLRQHVRHRRLLHQKAGADIGLLEAERRRLARDIHDDVGPLLSLAGLHIGAVRQAPAAADHAGKAADALEQAVISLSNIANQLTPSALQRRGLETALRDYLHHFQEGSAIHFRLHYEVCCTPPEEQALQIYRMVQELVHNAVKHSGATAVALHLKEKGPHLLLHYTDNGRGFHWPTGDQPPKGMGLHSLQSRTHVLGGTLRHRTAQGKGTEYLFTLPKYKA